MGSNSLVVKPKEAEGINPIEPLMTLASSVRISPKRFSVINTSYAFGHWTKRMATASTNSYSTFTSGYSGASLWTVSLHSREVAITLALSTQVSSFLLFWANSKPIRASLSISSTEYTLVSKALVPCSFLPRGSPKYTPPVNSLKNTKSVPSILSCFKGDLCKREGNVNVGRTLANRPSFFLVSSNPCSGRTFALGSLSYLGSPIAPKSTASDWTQISWVTSG